MTNLFRTVLEFLVQDKASAALTKIADASGKAGKAADETAASFKNLAGSFTGMVVAKHIKNLLEGLIAPALRLNQAMHRLAFTMGQDGIMGKSLQALRKNAEEVAKFTTYGPAEAMDATVMLARALRDTKSTAEGTMLAAGLAQSSFNQMSLDKSAKMVADMAKAFGFSGEMIKVAGDKMSAVTKFTGTGIENFADIMGRLATAGTVGGQSFDEMLKTFALVNRVIPDAKNASTLLASMMTKLSDPKTQADMKDVAKVMDDATMRIRPMSDILRDLSKHADIHGPRMRMALTEAFGSKMAKPMIATVTALKEGIVDVNGETYSGAQLLTKLNSVLGKSYGSLQEAIDAAMKSPEARLQQAEEAWTNFKTTLGDNLLPLVKTLAEMFIAVIEPLRDFLQLLQKNEIASWATRAIVSIAGLVLAFRAWSLFSAGLSGIIAAVGAATASVTPKTYHFAKAAGYAKLQLQAQAYALKATEVGMHSTARSMQALGVVYELTAAKARMMHKAMVALKAVGGFILFEAAMYAWQKFQEIREGLKKEGAALAKDPAKLQDRLNNLMSGGILSRWEAWLLEKEAKQIAYTKGIERIKELEAQKRHALELEAAGKAANAMVLGSKPFQDTVQRLEKLTGSKQKAFKLSDLVMMQKWLKKVSEAKVGQQLVSPETGRLVTVQKGQPAAAANALTDTYGAMEALEAGRKQYLKTGKMSDPKMMQRAQDTFTQAQNVFKMTVDPLAKKAIERAMSPAVSLGHQLGAPQVEARTAFQRMTGEKAEVGANTTSDYAFLNQREYLAQQRVQGKLKAKAPLPGAFLADERQAEGRMDSWKEVDGKLVREVTKTTKATKKTLDKLNKEIERINVNLDRIDKVGLKVENKGDPGKLPGLPNNLRFG